MVMPISIFCGEILAKWSIDEFSSSPLYYRYLCDVVDGGGGGEGNYDIQLKETIKNCRIKFSYVEEKRE